MGRNKFSEITKWLGLDISIFTIIPLNYIKAMGG